MIELYDFQKEDLAYFADFETYPNVLCASEMGIGKTVIAVARDDLIRQFQWELRTKFGDEHRTLVVAPLSTHSAWRWHFNEMMPNLRVHVVDSTNKTTREKILIGDWDVAVVHWEGLRLLPGLKQFNFLHVIADECHRMQNRNAQQTTAIKALKTIYKTALSGTPVTTSPDKFWSVLNWLYPKDWSSYWRYYGKFVNFEVAPQGYRKVLGPRLENVPLLHEKIDPYYRRHLKKRPCHTHHPKGVQEFLPDKVYARPLVVELSSTQRKAYEAMRKDALAWVGPGEDKPVASPVAIAKLMRLQQLALSSLDVLADGSVVMREPSTKLDAIVQLIKDTDEQVVIFSQFKQFIKLLTKRLVKEKITHLELTGDTPGMLRGKLIEDFQAGKRRVFCGTIGAGGVGITLTAASTVVFADRSWSPALNDQAEDRLWRIGQPNTVEVIDVIARNTVDLGRKQAINLRASWIRTLLDPAQDFQGKVLAGY